MSNYNWDATPEELIRITHLSALGARLDTIARLLGIHVKTLLAARKRNPLIDEAIDMGRAQVEEKVLGKLMKMIDDESHKSHAAAVFFYCKTQLGMREVERAEQPTKPSRIEVDEVA